MNKTYIKIVLLGDGRVGKTSILNRYINNIFNDKQEMTINCSYYQKEIEFNGIKYTFCLWDTAGQEKFNALTSIYYRDAKGAILVYDVTLKESFKKVEKWYEELKVFNKETVMILAGNKIDKGKMDIEDEVIGKFCKERGMENVFTSAKTGEGLDEVFYNVAKGIVDNDFGLKNGSGENRKKSKLKISLDQGENGKKEKEKENCC